MFKSRVLLVLVLVFVTLAAIPTQAQDTVTLEFVNWIGAEEATADDLEAMIADFEARHPNIKIDNQPVPFNQSLETLLTRSLGGDAPDVSMAHVTWVAPLNDAGVLTPLQDLLPNQDDYVEGILDAMTIDGDMMAVPWAPSPIAMYVNMELLEQAGYSEPPKTWDEMIEMAYAVTALGTAADGGQIYGLGVSSQPLVGAGYFLLPFIWAFGGEFQDEAGNIVLDSPETVAAFTQVQQLFNDGVSPSGLEIRNLRELFAQGRIAFHWDIEQMVQTFANLSPRGEEFRNAYEIALIPGMEEGVPAPTVTIYHMLVIYEDTPYKEEAAMFIDYLTGPDGLTIYNDYGSNKLPVRKSSSEIEFFSREEASFLDVFIQAVQGPARAMPAKDSAFLAAMEAVAVANQRVALNNEDPAQVVQELQTEIKDLYGQ